MVLPNENKILSALRAATLSIYESDRDSLSVKSVRIKVTKDLKLDDGFFMQDEWRIKSKEFIKNYAEELIEAQGEHTPEPSPVKTKPLPEKKATAPVQKGTKRTSSDDKARPSKRQKKQKTPSEASDDDLSGEDVSDPSPEDSEEESSFGGSEIDEPKPKSKSALNPKASAKKQLKKSVSSDEEEDESLSDAPSSVKDSNSEVSPPTKKKITPKKPANASPSKPQPKKAKVESESEDKAYTKNNTKSTPKKEAGKSQLSKAEDSNAEDKSAPKPEDSDSEMSVVIDEAPPPKKKASSKGTTNERKFSSKSFAKTVSAQKPAKDLSPDEALLKTLQNQLKKCGIKKIFQFELKKYGDDTKAKIKHLQKEMRDVGMVGRFSESRAREIKEQRELLADLEAVKEGEEKWGKESGGRASRAKVKSFKESTGSGEEDEEEDEKKKETSSRSGSEAPTPRKQRARQDLAFLDDDEEDSD